MNKKNKQINAYVQKIAQKQPPMKEIFNIAGVDLELNHKTQVASVVSKSPTKEQHREKS